MRHMLAIRVVIVVSKENVMVDLLQLSLEIGLIACRSKIKTEPMAKCNPICQPLTQLIASFGIVGIFRA